jgi:hypothetical protein
MTMTTTTRCPETSTSSEPNLLDELEDLLKLSVEGQGRVLAQIPLNKWGGLLRDFGFLALKHQKPPALAKNGEPWTTWLILGGRGAGKTRAGAEWVRRIALSDPKARIALIAETEDDAREVMVEGVSGLLAVHRSRERPKWTSSRGLLRWLHQLDRMKMGSISMISIVAYTAMVMVLSVISFGYLLFGNVQAKFGGGAPIEASLILRGDLGSEGKKVGKSIDASILYLSDRSVLFDDGGRPTLVDLKDISSIAFKPKLEKLPFEDILKAFDPKLKTGN